MPNINFKINFSFFLVLLSIIILAFIEGSAISKAVLGEKEIYIGELQSIAFILITIFMIAVLTLRPNRMILVSYSSMTLGLILIVTSLFDQKSSILTIIRVIQSVIGVVLIISGFFMGKELKVIDPKQKIIIKQK